MLFYFIVVHSPKEKKKQAIYQIINNASFEIQSYIAGYFNTLMGTYHPPGTPVDLSQSKLFHEKCKTISLNTPVQGVFYMSHGSFNSHFECYGFLATQIQKNFTEIIHFYDLLSPEYLYSLNKIHESFKRPPFNGTRTANQFVDSLSIGMEENCKDGNAILESAHKFKKKAYEEHVIPFKIRALKARLK